MVEEEDDLVICPPTAKNEMKEKEKEKKQIVRFTCDVKKPTKAGIFLSTIDGETFFSFMTYT